MFTRLDEMRVGDYFYLDVMGRTLGYKVDRITEINPDDTSKLKIVPGEDRVTLMTCTPYGVNTHRLLVPPFPGRFRRRPMPRRMRVRSVRALGAAYCCRGHWWSGCAIIRGVSVGMLHGGPSEDSSYFSRCLLIWRDFLRFETRRKED